MENLNEQEQLKAVRRNGLVIRDIKNPSEQVQLAAIERNSGAIEYIKNPTGRVIKEYLKRVLDRRLSGGYHGQFNESN